MTGRSPPRWRSRRRDSSREKRGATARSFPGRRRAMASRSSRRSSRAESRSSTSTRRTSKRRSPGQPDCLAVLKLHYLRWVLFPIKGETYFMYQGIFDTDFDKYTEDAVALFTKLGINTVFENLEGLPQGLEDERAGLHQVRARAPVPELPRIRRVSVRERRRDQEGAASSRRRSRRCSTRCSERRSRACSNSTTSSTSC